MQTLKSVVTGLCSMALVLTPVAALVAAPLAGALAEEPWEIVPEDSLRDLRGGMDLGDLVGSFAIQRVVEIDGVVVARMQLVISNLDRLAKGGMPTITVTVNKLTPTISWASPAAISYGTALSVTQLNATATIPGSFAYTPTAGTVLAAGSQPLTVTFTPTDSTDYAGATTSV